MYLSSHHGFFYLSDSCTIYVYVYVVISRWWFAGGLYMMKIDPQSLRLTAIYGLFVSASIIAFGAILGKWIDKTKRLSGTFNDTMNITLDPRRFLVWNNPDAEFSCLPCP